MEIDPGGANFPHHRPREEEMYLILDGYGVQVAGSGMDGIVGRFPSGLGDAWYYRPNAKAGYYSGVNVASRILRIRSWQPGLEPGLPHKLNIRLEWHASTPRRRRCALWREGAS